MTSYTKRNLPEELLTVVRQELKMGLFSSKSRTSDSPDSIDDSQLEEYLTEGLSNYKPGANDSKPTQNFYVNDKAVLKTQGYDLFKTIGCGAYAVVKRGKQSFPYSISISPRRVEKGA